MLLDIFDPKAPPQAVGIDLGTTHSILAYVRDDKPVAVVSCDGSPLLPSVVHYGRHGQVLVGKAAQSFAAKEPTRTIASVKRFMGRGADDPQTNELGTYRFASSEAGQGVVAFDVGGHVVTAIEVSAEILKSLKLSASEQLHGLGGAVITVPAYFDDAQRQATRDAGRLAGLNVLRLLSEPTAAALAYGLESQNNGTFAIFDLGGGTFDVTILKLEDGVFQVKSTGGDSALGGDDMDRLIAANMLTAMGFEVAGAPREVIALALDAARQAKHGLSDETRVALELPKLGGGTVAFELERGAFEAAILPLLERAGKSCRRALRDAELSPTEIDAVVLVGGATRVPRVRGYVTEIFGKAPLAGIDPDLVVAYGAALQARMLSDNSSEALLLDVLPLSLGIETMGGAVDKILPRNSTIPVGAKATFTTYADHQTGFEIHVVQGERELARDCRSLAHFTLKGIPALPAGQARLEVSFDVDENGLLTVSARELTTGAAQSIEVKPSYGLTDEAVEDMLLQALDHGETDLEQRRLIGARVEAERLLLATRKALQSDADLLSDADRDRIEAASAELAQRVRESPKPTAVEAAMRALESATHQFAGARMNRAIARAIEGQQVDAIAAGVSGAQGVDAHVEAHQRAKLGRAPEQR